MDKQELLDLQEEINTAKQKVNQLEGRKEYLMQQLKEQWNCSSVKQAEKKLEDYAIEIAALTTQIQDGVKELEEKYEFD